MDHDSRQIGIVMNVTLPAVRRGGLSEERLEIDFVMWHSVMLLDVNQRYFLTP